MSWLGGMIDGSSNQTSDYEYTDQQTQDLTDSEVTNQSGFEDTIVSDEAVISDIGRGSTITITDGGAIEGANEATLAALDNTAILAADTSGKLLDANDNATALADSVVDNNTALTGLVIDDITALTGTFSNNLTALAGEVMGNANSSAAAAVDAANSSIALAGNANDNLTALAGVIVENSNNATATFSDFATTANSNNTALAGLGFDSLNANNEQSLAVINQVALAGLHTAEVGMGAIRDTAGMGLTTAQNIAEKGLDKLGDNSIFAITALANESAHSKDALTTLGGYALATTEKQFDGAMTQLGMSNRSAQADMVSISGQSADLMSDTLGNVLTNGQVSMQKSANEGMKTVGWVAGAAVVAIVVMTAVKG